MMTDRQLELEALEKQIRACRKWIEEAGSIDEANRFADRHNELEDQMEDLMTPPSQRMGRYV
jgi:hypothetical protein